MLAATAGLAPAGMALLIRPQPIVCISNDLVQHHVKGRALPNKPQGTHLALVLTSCGQNVQEALVVFQVAGLHLTVTGSATHGRGSHMSES